MSRCERRTSFQVGGDFIGELTQHTRHEPLHLGSQIAAIRVRHRAEQCFDAGEVAVATAAMDDSREDLGELHRSPLAGRALTARLDGEESGQFGGDGHDVGRVVVDGEPRRAESAAVRLERLVGERDVERPRRQNRIGDAGERRLQRSIRLGATASVDHVDQRRAQLDLVDARNANVADDRHDHGAGRVGSAERAVPRRPAGKDVRRRRQRLDVVDERWIAGLAGTLDDVPASQPIVTVANRPCCHGGNSRGNGSRPSMTSSSPFSSPNRYSSGPSTIEMASSPSSPASPSSTVARRRLATSATERPLDADVRGRSVDAEGGDGESFDDAVRVGAHQRAILERRRLTLGTVGHGVVRSAASGPHRGPLGAGREASAAPAPQAAGSDLLDRRLGAECSGSAQPLAPTARQIVVERRDRRRRQQQQREPAHQDLVGFAQAWGDPLLAQNSLRTRCTFTYQMMLPMIGRRNHRPHTVEIGL